MHGKKGEKLLNLIKTFLSQFEFRTETSFFFGKFALKQIKIKNQEVNTNSAELVVLKEISIFRKRNRNKYNRSFAVHLVI